MSKSQKPEPTHLKKELQRCVDQALDQLEQEMTFMYAQNSALVTTWVTHELAAGEKSFEEVALQLVRSFMLPHDLHGLKQVGMNLQREIEEHTLDGDI